jgi:threonine dehydratase
VVVVSGGNIDPPLSKLVRHGLTAAGRYLAFRCRLPDHPGSLGKLLGDLGANVIEVAHEQLAPRLHVDEAEVVLQVEARGPEHCAHVISAARRRLRPRHRLIRISCRGGPQLAIALTGIFPNS